MVFRMTARGHEHDGNAIARVRVVVAAAVVLSRMTVRVVRVVELERGREFFALDLDDVAELCRQPSRADELQVAGTAAGRQCARSTTDHIDVDLSNDGIARNGWVIGEVS